MLVEEGRRITARHINELDKAGVKALLAPDEYLMGKVLAHDEDNRCKVGDTVEITPCRPISKRKSWRVVNVIG